MERFNNLQFHIQTDVGVTRDHNEDAVGLYELDGDQPAILLVVADGMGGEAAGEVASRMLVDAFEGFSSGEEHAGHREAMAARIEHANREIVALADQHPAMKGMGSTVVAARFDKDGAVDFVHVGDSRLYLYRDGELERVTRDHSRVQLFVDEGILTPEQAERHPEANVLTQAVGRESVRVDKNEDKQLTWHGGTFLVCSDGLTGMLPEDVVAHAMASLDVEELTDALIEECNRLGATDNISIAVLRDGDPESPMTRAAFHREVPVWVAAHDFKVRQQEEADDQARKQREADAHAQAEARAAAKKEAWDKAAEASLGGGDSDAQEAPRRQTANKRARYLIIGLLVLAIAAAVTLWVREREPSERSDDSTSVPVGSAPANVDEDEEDEIDAAPSVDGPAGAAQTGPDVQPAADPETSSEAPTVADEAAENVDEPAPATGTSPDAADPQTGEAVEVQPSPPQRSQAPAERTTAPRSPGSGSTSPPGDERPGRLGSEPPTRQPYELPDGPSNTATQPAEQLQPPDKELQD